MKRLAVIGAAGVVLAVAAFVLNFYVGREAEQPADMTAAVLEPPARSGEATLPGPGGEARRPAKGSAVSPTEAAPAAGAAPTRPGPAQSGSAQSSSAPSAPAQPAPAAPARPSEAAGAVPRSTEPGSKQPRSNIPSSAGAVAQGPPKGPAPARPESVPAARPPAPQSVSPPAKATPPPAAAPVPPKTAREMGQSPPPPSARAPSSPPAIRPSSPAPSPATPQVAARPQGSAGAPVEAPAPRALGPRAPAFDVVRIQPDGDAVIAGRAPPGWEVVVRDGDTEIGRVKADRRGEWVLLPERRLPPGTRQLRLTARAPDGRVLESESVVVLIVPERETETAAAAPPSPPVAVELPRSGRGRARLLQAPPRQTAKGQRLTLDLIEYDWLGDFAAAGHATPGAKVRLALNGEVLGTEPADAEGAWRIDPDYRLRPGRYALSVEELDAAGAVNARVDLAFEHGGPVPDWPRGREIIVVRGHTLWWIARRVYGRGARYSVIFSANRGEITDPDLIFPGQVFTLPRIN